MRFHGYEALRRIKFVYTIRILNLCKKYGKTLCNELMIYRTFTLYTTDVTRLLYQLQTRISLLKMMLFCTVLDENGGGG